MAKANAIIEGKISNLKGEPAPLNRHKLPLTDNSGQVFPSRRGGDAAEADMLLSDICAAARQSDDGENEIYALQLRTRDTGSFTFCDAEGNEIDAATAAPEPGKCSRHIPPQEQYCSSTHSTVSRPAIRKLLQFLLSQRLVQRTGAHDALRRDERSIIQCCPTNQLP